MLKETRKSLRIYFGLIATFSFLSGAAVVSRGGDASLVVVLALVNIGFGILFTYIVIKFDELLARRTGFIKNVLTANLAMSGIVFGLSLFAGVQLGASVRMLVAVLIYIYLVKSISRLSAESGLQNA